MIDQRGPDMKQALANDVFHAHSRSIRDKGRGEDPGGETKSQNEWRTKTETGLCFVFSFQISVHK